MPTTSAPPADELVTIRAAATRLTVSEATVRRWIKDRTLPHYRLIDSPGGRPTIRVWIRDLTRHLARSRVDAA